MNDFSWARGNDDVVFPSTQGVEIYTNPDGDFVIRQQAVSIYGEDSIVIIPEGEAENFLLAFKSEAEIL